MDEQGLKSEEFEVVKGTELSIARAAYRNGSSKYFINDNTSNHGEVTTLLKSRGVDLEHKRFLILQGEVESIAQMKPKAQTEHDDGLLEYLEDIIGTSKYKDPINELNTEIEALNENRMERLNRVKHVEKEMNALEGRKEEAEAYMMAENEVALLQSTLYQVHVYEQQLKVNASMERTEALQGELQGELEHNKALIDSLKHVQITFKEKSTACKKITDAADELNQALAQAEKKEAALSEKKKHAATKHNKLSKALEKDRHTRLEMVQTIENLEHDIQTAAKDTTEAEELLQKEEAELAVITNSLKGKTDVFMDEIQEKKGEIGPHLEEQAAKKQQLDLLASEKDILVGKLESYTATIQESKQALQDNQALVKDKACVCGCG
jgi:structural maintenance of chromosome 4